MSEALQRKVRNAQSRVTIARAEVNRLETALVVARSALKKQESSYEEALTSYREELLG